MIYSTRKFVTDHESNLLNVIRGLEFGEINGVEHVEQARSLEMDVSRAEDMLIELLRHRRHIEKIVVHQKAPVNAEIPVVIMGFSGTQKIRF